MREKKFFSQSKYPVSGIAQEPFNICEVHLEPLKPSQHCQERRAVFGINILRCYDPIDRAGYHLRFIMLVRYKTIRKLVVMSVTFRAAEPTDHKILFYAAFLLPDTWSGIAVLQSTATDRADRGVITARNKKHRSPPCRSVCILI